MAAGGRDEAICHGRPNHRLAQSVALAADTGRDLAARIGRGSPGITVQYLR
jgi:hypothetical protein